MKGAIKWVCWLTALALGTAAALGHSKCMYTENIDEFDGESTNMFLCITEDRAAHFYMMCHETGYLMGVDLVERYMETEGERIKLEYSIDRGRIVGDIETVVLEMSDGGQLQVVASKESQEAVERLSGYFPEAKQLAIRSKLKHHGTSTAVFRFDSSSRSAHADFVNACGR